MNTRLKLDIKELTALKEHFKHSRCFYPNCNETAIKAHSIQAKGPLSIIADNVDAQGQQVYFLEDALQYIPNEKVTGLYQSEFNKLRNRGIGEASTFKGFCDKHDKIFKKIEDVSFSATVEQQFLFMYRAFAYNMHEQISGNKGMSTVFRDMRLLTNDPKAEINVIKESTDNEAAKGLIDSLTGVLSSMESMINDMVKAIPNELRELDANNKLQLDKMILEGAYDTGNYLTRSFEGVFPWAASSVVNYIGNFMIASEDGVAYSNSYAITVLPDKNSMRTHVLIASLNETPNAKPQMNYFKSLSSSNFKKLISNLIIERAINVYFSPRMIHSFSEEQMKYLINARRERDKFKVELGVKEYDLNLFSKEFLEF